MQGGRGKGRKKLRLPAGLVRLQNPYTRWTGALIGAEGWNLIDACQSKVVFLPADDALTEALLFLSYLLVVDPCKTNYYHRKLRVILSVHSKALCKIKHL